MTDRETAPPRDRGDTLVEILVSVAILGIAVVAILGAIAMTATASGLHRDTASVQNLLHNWAESVSDGPYTACASAATVQSAVPSPALPTGFSAQVTAVRYWDGSAFAGSCGTDQGLQRITLSIAGPGSPGAAGTLDVVRRRPCGSGC